MKQLSLRGARIRVEVRRRGFSLIELIGVMAIISVLAALVVPTVFDAVTKAQINSIADTSNGLKGALTHFYAENGRFPASPIDETLIEEGILEQKLQVPNGEGVIVTRTGADAIGVAASKAGFDLTGDETAPSDTRSGTVLILKIDDLTAGDRQGIDEAIDGAELSSSTGDKDERGRVVYDGNPLYMYLLHR